MDTMRRQRETSKKVKQRDNRLFTLEVFLFSGPMTKEFVEKNREVSRTIQIRGDQTLEDLHNAIFEAFDREEEHMYEFQMAGKRPMDPKARRYVLSAATEDLSSEKKPAGKVNKTTIGSIGLKLDESFGYWFDFGDDWWHQINVVSIEEEAPQDKYPKITGRIGESPPQYPDWEEMEE
jgi:hypothetical protein